jgi:hypothetical protein
MQILRLHNVNILQKNLKQIKWESVVDFRAKPHELMIINKSGFYVNVFYP